jgi:peptide-methionine (S)-S-oxide reductase
MMIPLNSSTKLRRGVTTVSKAYQTTIQRHSFHPTTPKQGRCVSSLTTNKPTKYTIASTSSTTTSTTLYGNFFSNIFRSFSVDGGSFNLKIDYDLLPFPGPEVAKLAIENSVVKTSPSYPELELATFAGGCFWGLELALQRLEGVEYTAVGYTQGNEQYPNYEQVCAGSTGHTEAVIVYYNPQMVSYKELVQAFLNRIDPTTVNGQGRDYGKQYRTGIYTHTPEQQETARIMLQEEQPKYKRPIATELRNATPFWPAELYHQQYLEKGGRFGTPQSAEKGCQDEIRCYG